MAIDDDDWSLHHRRHPQAFAHQRESAPRGCAHGANAGMSSSDGHIDHANLVFHLPHHDAGLARVRGHPVQNPRGWTHRISAVELHAGGHPAHRKRHIPTEHGVAVLGHRHRRIKRLEVLRGILITAVSDGHILRNHGITFLLELLGKHRLQCLKTDPHHAKCSTHSQRILSDLIAADVRKFRNGKRTKLHAICSRS